ncbi:HD domain-containing phosphohydrolase [Niveibacterium sp. SC-1]|uniref:HD-GYP domain-containing protein n=1 Tax=Niveibacterium sp. SC-1 TaxID=3135646 RepID=UPI00311DCA3E
MQLLRLLAEHVQLEKPLPWNVYDAGGTLLLSKGYLLTASQQLDALFARGMYADAEALKAHWRGSNSPARPQAFDPFSAWSEVQTRLSLLLREHRQTADFTEKFSQLAQAARRSCEKDPDVGIFMMMQLDLTRYAVAHSVHCGIVCELIASKLGWSESEREVLAKAALSMNIGMVELQATLAAQSGPPNERQRGEIREHPERGRIMLATAGVSDSDWLTAVAEHHETPDGHGYPCGKQSVGQLSELIRVADVFGAKVSARAGRCALQPDQAARALFLSMGGNTNPLAAMLIKEVGIYPPGSFVRLANGETAIVVRRGERANTPSVAAFANPSGVAYGEPLRRDTAKAEFAVSGCVPREKVMVRVNPARLYGYERG